MSKRGEIKKQIKASEAEIEALEKKRLRSQSAILEAMLNKTEPSEQDADCFRTYSELIEVERENLRNLKGQLINISKRGRY